MAGFKAEGIVDALDFDFRPYVNAAGTIPEPTDIQISEFLAGIKKVIDTAQKDIPSDIPADDPAALLMAIDDLDPNVVAVLMGDMNEVFAGLCSGTPSKEQISALPMRVRQIFFGWLQTEVMAPEAATGGGKAQVSTLRTARAG